MRPLRVMPCADRCAAGAGVGPARAERKQAHPVTDLDARTMEAAVLNRVLGIQYLDSRRACTLFLLLRRLSYEETMSTRLTHDLWCNWTGLIGFPRSLFKYF
jgi:hypothetical protein